MIRFARVDLSSDFHRNVCNTYKTAGTFIVMCTSYRNGRYTIPEILFIAEFHSVTIYTTFIHLFQFFLLNILVSLSGSIPGTDMCYKLTSRSPIFIKLQRTHFQSTSLRTVVHFSTLLNNVSGRRALNPRGKQS